MQNSKLRVAAEWEQHKATLLAWPHNKEDWPGKFMPIHWVYAEIVRHITRYEKALVVVEDARQQVAVTHMLGKAQIDMAQVDFVRQKTDRSWMRDSAPLFVIAEQRVKAVSFAFNGWAKYANWKKDRHLPQAVAKKLGMVLESCIYQQRHVVLEGGAIDTNGCGTLITTEECLLHPSIQVRNPNFTREDYAQLFNEHFGITNVIWLGEGIAGDDTHGHVDDLCRFVNRHTVVLCVETNARDENYLRLLDNRKRLASARLEDGTKLRVVDLPMPKPVIFDGMRLPASYANFIFTNGSVLVPTFNDRNDRIALNILSELFPEHEVIGIHAVDLVWGLGTLHCLSHEIPTVQKFQCK